MAFLGIEQQKFLEAIVQLEDGKRRSYHFVFLLTGAYIAFCAAPYSVSTRMDPSGAIMYAISGIALSCTLVFYSLRFLRALGRSNRRRAFLYKAITTNRAWVMRDRQDYFQSTVFPADEYYARTPGAAGTAAREDFPTQYDYSASTSLFFAFVQILYVLGAVYFVSLIFGAVDALLSPAAPDSSIASAFGVRMPPEVLLRGTLASTLALMLWVQFLANECKHYQQAIWEAKRISVRRPNPIFASNFEKGWRATEHTILRWMLIGVLAWAAGTSAMALAVDSPITTNWLLQPLANPVIALVMLCAFAVCKLLWALVEFTHADRNERAASAANGGERPGAT